MNLPTLCTPVDGQLGVLAADYTPGSNTITLVDASRVAAQTPTQLAPVRFAVVSPDGNSICQFKTAGMPVDQSLSVMVDSDSDYPDVALPAGSVVEVTASSAAFKDVHAQLILQTDAITTLQNAASGVAAVTSVNGKTGVVVLGIWDISGLGTIASHAATDYLTPTGSGSGLTALNASALALGTVPPARMGSGTPSTSNFLRGDGSWSTPPPAPVSSVANRTGAVTLSTADVSGLATVASTGLYGDLSGRPTLATVATTGSYFDLTNRPTLGALAALSGIGGLTAAGTGVTIDGAGTVASPYMIASNGGGSGSTSPGGASGAVQYEAGGSFAGDAANFAWDATNHRLGIGTATPTASLTVAGAGLMDKLPISSGSPNYHFKLTDSGGAAIFSIFSAYGYLYNRYNAASNPNQRFDIGLTNGVVALNPYDDTANQSMPVVINAKGFAVVGQDPTVASRTTKAAPGQFADLDQWQDASGIALSGVSAGGYVR